MRINVFDSWLTRATDNGGVERRVGERHVRSERDDTGAVRCGNAGAAAAAGAGAAGADAGTAGADAGAVGADAGTAGADAGAAGADSIVTMSPKVVITTC